MPNETTRGLEHLVLHYEIVDLLSRYAQALDSGRVAEAVGLFTANGVFEAAVGATSTGHVELTKYYSDQWTDPEWAYYRGGQHLNVNTLITSTDGDQVAASTDFVYVVPADPAPRIAFLGRYEDVIEKVDGLWLFAHRRVIANPGLNR
jgi:hypothetical protein